MKLLIAFGILLLVAGFSAYFWPVTVYTGGWYSSSTATYPYQSLGTALIVAGAVLIGFGVLCRAIKGTQD